MDDGGDRLLLVVLWWLPEVGLLLFFGDKVGDRLTTDDGLEPLWDLDVFEAAKDFRSSIS